MEKVVIATMPEIVFHKIPQHLKSEFIDYKVERDDYHLYKDSKEYKEYNEKKKALNKLKYKIRND